MGSRLGLRLARRLRGRATSSPLPDDEVVLREVLRQRVVGRRDRRRVVLGRRVVLHDEAVVAGGAGNILVADDLCHCSRPLTGLTWQLRALQREGRLVQPPPSTQGELQPGQLDACDVQAVTHRLAHLGHPAPLVDLVTVRAYEVSGLPVERSAPCGAGGSDHVDGIPALLATEAGEADDQLSHCWHAVCVARRAVERRMIRVQPERQPALVPEPRLSDALLWWEPAVLLCSCHL